MDSVLGIHPRRVLVQNGRGLPGRMQTYAVTQLDYEGVWATFRSHLSRVRGRKRWLRVTAGREIWWRIFSPRS